MATKEELYVNGELVPNVINIKQSPEPTFGDGTGRDTLDMHFSRNFFRLCNYS